MATVSYLISRVCTHGTCECCVIHLLLLSFFFLPRISQRPEVARSGAQNRESIPWREFGDVGGVVGASSNTARAETGTANRAASESRIPVPCVTATVVAVAVAGISSFYNNNYYRRRRRYYCYDCWDNNTRDINFRAVRASIRVDRVVSNFFLVSFLFFVYFVFVFFFLFVWTFEIKPRVRSPRAPLILPRLLVRAAYVLSHIPPPGTSCAVWSNLRYFVFRGVYSDFFPCFFFSNKKRDDPVCSQFYPPCLSRAVASPAGRPFEHRSHGMTDLSPPPPSPPPIVVVRAADQTE